MKITNGKSVCETGNEDILAKMIKDVFIDDPSNEDYKFDKNPPILNGQTGIPPIVDKILGNYLLHSFSKVYFIPIIDTFTIYDTTLI